MSEKIPQMVTIKKAAELFGLPEHFIRQKVKSGEIVAVKAGKKYLVNVDKLAEYLNSHTVTEPEKSPADDMAAAPLKGTVKVNTPKPTSGITPIPANLR